MSEIAAPAEPVAPHKFILEAQAVLRNNRLNTFTKPAPSLYPHQWNWDAGFIALGYMHFDFRQACAEFNALFRGQWANGMVPDCVFLRKQG